MSKDLKQVRGIDVQYLEEENPRQRTQPSRGPKVGVYLMCSKNSKEGIG